MRRPWKLPYAMGPVYLAGAFSEACDVRLYNEVSDGPLEDAGLLGWPDMLVLTGLTNGFDRMLHLAAYARTRNPRVIVVAGGPPIRALPLLSRRYFDYACTGDIEELREVIREAWGATFAADEMLPRYDLASWIGSMGHAEASRACNFLCSFCSLTAEGGKYRSYPIEYVRQQIVAMGRKKRLFFVDNNFYGAHRRSFEARVDLVDEMRQRGYFTDWGALVTNDFFYLDENLEKVQSAGCTLLFSGVESFDRAWLQDVNKLQNLRRSPVEMIVRCLEKGIMFAYGLILDVMTRRLADLRRELDFVVGTPEIPLPGFLTLPIPLLATPFFRQCLAEGAFLPRTRLRDMDGSTLVLRTLDPMEEVATFVRDVMALRGYRRRALRHAARFAYRYRSALSLTQLTLAMGSAGLLCAEGLITGLGFGAGGRLQRTHITSTEVLDPMYTPAFRVSAQYEPYFRPTMVTDSAGNLTEDLAELALATPRQGSIPRPRGEARPARTSVNLTTGAR